MTETIKFSLDGKEAEAAPGETIWQVARRQGTEIPHLCYRDAPDYRGDGNCRACMVEIDGEPRLSASCIRMPEPGMAVQSTSQRAQKARRMVFELLITDQKSLEGDLKTQAHALGVTESRFPAGPVVDKDSTHTAINVDLDNCIQCGLCVRACREVQGNDVIGLAWRGARARITFDQDDPLGDSSCVACGECVQVCPTDALTPSHGTGQVVDKQVNSLCPYCGVGCQVTLHVGEGRIQRVEGRNGPANRNRLCVKGRFGLDYVNHPQRLTQPMIRKEGTEKSWELSIDPDDPLKDFRPASWEEALAKAAGGLVGIRGKSGPGALAGLGSAKGSNEEAYLFQKLVRTGFRTNNVDHCTRLCHASSVAALLECIGSGAVTAPVVECLNSELIIVIGANPGSNHPVAASFIRNAVNKGAELVIMDPSDNYLSPYAAHRLNFYPGSDVALLNALLHVIIGEGLHDEQYMMAHTEGFDELSRHVKAFDPEKMAPICGIDAETLRLIARKYATAKSAMIFWGMGVAQHTHGTDNARCLIALALICGQIGREGAGLHPLRGQNNVQGASDVGLIPMMYPNYKLVNNPDAQRDFEKFWGCDLDPDKGLTVVEITHAIHDGQIRGMYIMGENPAMSDPDTKYTREAFAKLDHLVVQDIFPTETVAFADVILPATSWLEKDGTVTNSDRRVQMGRRALDAPGDARQDLWIIQEIARGLGLDWDYDGPRDVYEEMRGCMASIANIPWDRLEREDAVTHPCDAEDEPGRDIIFTDGFPTPSGRGKLVPAGILPPDETPDETFPFILTTGRILEHWHTGAMTRRSAALDEIEPEPSLQISPGDLKGLGIEPGGLVTVTSRRGTLTLATRPSQDMPAGLVFMPFCFAEAAANMLTNPALDPFGKIPELKFAAVSIKPA